MIGKTNAGGAGGGLALKVVGGAVQPASPVNNTIWIETDTEITGYTISAAEPESPATGAVWIKTAVISDPAINLDKRNTILLYPDTAQQYTGAEWEGKPAHIFADGEWREIWNGYYYKSGEVYEAVTGGYETTTSDNTSGNNNALLTFNSNNMVLTASNTGTQGGNMVVSVNAIDVTDINTLVFDCYADSTDSCAVGVTSAKGVWGGAVASKSVTNTTRASVSVDVSGVTGKVYILLKAWWNPSTYKGKLTVHNIYKQ